MILFINHAYKMRRKFLTYLCFVIMVLVSIPVFAKKKGPPPPQNQPPPVGLPIDASLYVLLVVGVVYGVYAIRKKFTIDD
jgi:hypothetical protein